MSKLTKLIFLLTAIFGSLTLTKPVFADTISTLQVKAYNYANLGEASSYFGIGYLDPGNNLLRLPLNPLPPTTATPVPTNDGSFIFSIVIFFPLENIVLTQSSSNIYDCPNGYTNFNVTFSGTTTLLSTNICIGTSDHNLILVAMNYDPGSKTIKFQLQSSLFAPQGTVIVNLFTPFQQAIKH